MESTTIGMNRTGAATSMDGARAMLQVASELSPASDIDTTQSKAERIRNIEDAESVGSIPPPATLKGVVKTGLATVAGKQPSLLMDKIGERLAYERSGVRLYECLITKYEALGSTEDGALPTAAEALASTDSDTKLAGLEGESPAQTLMRIRAEEHAHFKLLSQAIIKLGGDPTAQTPCADVTATASMGFVQVLSDPRTTLAQCLNVMLSAELTDNAGWELLARLADDAGEQDLAGQFLSALGQEQEHLMIVRAWLEHVLTEDAGTPAV
jgi:rubrerythrin